MEQVSRLTRGAPVGCHEHITCPVADSANEDTLGRRSRRAARGVKRHKGDSNLVVVVAGRVGGVGDECPFKYCLLYAIRGQDHGAYTCVG